MLLLLFYVIVEFSAQCRVLLNLRTSQPFEEVLEDLGQVLKMTGIKRMYTVDGDEVYSFSQLRNEYADVETFYLDSGPRAISPVSIVPVTSPLRRSRSSNGITMNAVIQSDGPVRQRARSKSRPRTLYAADSNDAMNRSNGGEQSCVNPLTKIVILTVFFWVPQFNSCTF